MTRSDTWQQAIEVLLDQRLFVLDSEPYGNLVHALDNPPAPEPKLRSLVHRAPPWLDREGEQ
jgi:uncharacterized protein (DUF1778 family)